MMKREYQSRKERKVWRTWRMEMVALTLYCWEEQWRRVRALGA